MLRQVKGVLGRRVGVGKLRLRVWLVLAGAAIALGVVGQAVGPVLMGSITGSAGVVVSQTVRLIDYAVGDPVTEDPADPGDDFSATVNDDGTGFTIALETEVGQTNVFLLALRNTSGKTANVHVQLHWPASLDVDLEEEADGQAACAQRNRNTWLCTVDPLDPPDGSPEFAIIVEPKDDAAPGVYTITGRILQVSG